MWCPFSPAMMTFEAHKPGYVSSWSAEASPDCRDAGRGRRAGPGELFVSADLKLQDASRALEQAQSRITAQEDRLAALEFKTQAAEAEAREAKNALALVEEAIRKGCL
jgi:hypothetical protein